jgi:hypothetical protein
MARHLLEDIWAALQLENLKDNEAILTCDFKMKILSFFFRVNQEEVVWKARDHSSGIHDYDKCDRGGVQGRRAQGSHFCHDGDR